MDPTATTRLEDIPNQETWCWYTQGKQLYSDSHAANILIDCCTFVQKHKNGEISLGYMGKELGEGTLTFVRVKTVSDLKTVHSKFPHLFEMEGNLYPLH
jgi:hypothetical protein